MMPLVVMSGAPLDRNREMRKLIKGIRRLRFNKPENYNNPNLSRAYNASDPSSRASMAQQLRVSALGAMMPNMSYGNVVRSSLAKATPNERHLLENPVFGRRSSDPSMHATKKRPRELSRNRTSQIFQLPKRARINNNNNIEFIGNSNSQTLPEGPPTTGMKIYIPPQPISPVKKNEYIMAKLAFAEKYPYYNPYYLTVEGPPGEVEAQGQLLPRGMIPRDSRPPTRKEIEAMPAGDDKTLLDFYYAWPDLIATTTGVYRDFLLKIYKKQSISDHSPTAFTLLIHESIIPRHPNPAFFYGVHLLLSDPRSFIALGQHYIEGFIQTLMNNGIYIPQREPRALPLGIRERIEFYMKLILFHPFTQRVNPWVTKIDEVHILARSGANHTRRVNTNMKKWKYQFKIVGKLILADRRVLDAAFAAAKNLALQYV